MGSSRKSIDTLLENHRILVKTLDRIDLQEPNCGIGPWKSECELLASRDGSALSSSTLLVPGRSVPVYTHAGRNYGMIFNAEDCLVYDVSPNDSNSNCTTKIAKRNLNLQVDLLNKNENNALTLDELSRQVKSEVSNSALKMNEVLMDAHKHACVGLFLLYDKNTDLKHFYRSLYELHIIKKYMSENFGYTNLEPRVYHKPSGTLQKAMTIEELKWSFNCPVKIHEKNNAHSQQSFADILSPAFKFPKYTPKPTVEEYISNQLNDFSEDMPGSASLVL